jgi:hypothetical protein
MRCELLLAAAERDGDIGAVTEKVELALFLEARLGPSETSRRKRKIWGSAETVPA